MEKELKLKEFFPPHSYEQWREEVEKQLKGAPFEKKLVKKTYEGIDIQPMYFAKDLEGIDHLNALPGGRPYVRGTSALGNTRTPWLVAQEIPYPDPVRFNQAARLDLGRGQTCLTIPMDYAVRAGQSPEEAEELGRQGLCVFTGKDMETAFSGIDLSQTQVRVLCGTSGVGILALFAAYMEENGKSAKALKGAFMVDPLAELAVTGKLPVSLDQAYTEMAALAAWAAKNAEGLRTVGVFGQPYNESGGSAVQELGFTMATAVEYLRRLMENGLSINEAARQLSFSFALGSDFFMEIAKMRAARLVFEQIVEAFGGNEEAMKISMHCRTSRWNKTVTDPWVNMLRTTTEAFSGICGGCDSMHTSAFDESIRIPDDFSRRVARNTQIVLREESHANKVVDPAAGSYYVENLTDQMAKKAWALFQEVEKMGGMADALEKGFVQEQLEETAKARQKNIALRKDVFVGTSKYANLEEKKLAKEPFDCIAFRKERTAQVNVYAENQEQGNKNSALEALSGKLDAESAIAAAKAGATLAEICGAIRKSGAKPAEITPVRIHRGAEVFENARAAADAYKEKTGSLPKIFLANMGSIPRHKPRADFTYGYFTPGGFDVLTNKGFQTTDEARDAAVQSGAKVVVICSTDDTYPDIVPELTKKLKDADPDFYVVLAGYPKDHVEAFEKAGVDEFIHIRSNALESIVNIQKRLGVIS